MVKRLLSSIFLTFCLWLIVYWSDSPDVNSFVQKSSHLMFSVVTIAQ